MIHRHGVLFEGVLRPPDRQPCALASERDRPVLVRISDTFGWPWPLPDWVGLAVRVFEPGVDDLLALTSRDRSFDLLLVSAAHRPQLWRRLRPERNVLACSFSSGMPYRIGDSEQVVVAVPDEPRSSPLAQVQAGQVPGPIRYRLDVGAEPGAWRGLGDLVLTRQHADVPQLRFHPPPVTTGLLPALRRLVYRWANGTDVDRTAPATPTARRPSIPTRTTRAS